MLRGKISKSACDVIKKWNTFKRHVRQTEMNKANGRRGGNKPCNKKSNEGGIRGRREEKIVTLF